MTFRDFADVDRWITREVEEVNREVKAIARNVAKAGEELTREFTETRPSAKSGKQGRIETAKMVDAITSGTAESTPARIVTYFGFNDPDEYFLYQTGSADGSVTGFTHHLSGEFIPATMALRDAADDAELFLDSELRRIAR